MTTDALLQQDKPGANLNRTVSRFFNEGFRLNPVDPQKDAAVISAFVLLSDDQNKLELFLPDQKDQSTIILNKDKQGIYQHDQYTYDPDKSVLYVQGIEKYRGNVE